jgi:hypothetical protein
MSKEREMIEKLCSFQMPYSDWLLLITEAEELLAQPEQDYIQYLLDQVARLTAENAMLKEKWSTPKPEPLSEEEIREGNPSMLNATREIFIAGVRFAEVMHGIGGGDE